MEHHSLHYILPTQDPSSQTVKSSSNNINENGSDNKNEENQQSNKEKSAQPNGNDGTYQISLIYRDSNENVANFRIQICICRIGKSRSRK